MNTASGLDTVQYIRTVVRSTAGEGRVGALDRACAARVGAFSAIGFASLQR